MSYNHGRAHSEAKAQLLPSISTRESTTSSMGQRSSAADEKSEKDLRQLRKRLSSATLGRVALGSLAGALPLYFIAFAILVYRQDGQLASDSFSQHLFQAAKAGPTIFSIMFAAIVGSFLKAMAASALERGTTVGSIECLMASRTVSAAATMPLRMRYLHPLVPMLLLLWAMSPLGGQAALRVVSPEAVLINQPSTFYYLNTTPGVFAIDGADAFEQFGTAVDVVFNAALVSPAKWKNSSYDIFGNLKFPMLEPIESTLAMDTSAGNSTFSMSTTYLYPNCSLTKTIYNASGALADPADQPIAAMDNVSNGAYLKIFWDRRGNHTEGSPYPVMLSSLSQSSAQQEDAEAETITLTNATCQVSLSNIEQRVSCIADACNTTSIRRIPGPPDGANLTGLYESTGSYYLFGGMINASLPEGKPYHPGYSSAFEYYFAHPDAPFTSLSGMEADGGWATLGDLAPEIFSQRFAQLLNTYYMAGTDPWVLTGNFSVAGNESTGDTESGYLSYYVSADKDGVITTSETVLRCNRPWLGVLLVTSVVMLFAGVVTTVLDGTRRGPDVLDAFTLALRDNRFVDLRINSAQDGVEMARDCKDARVRLGDVRSGEAVGHIAVATLSAEREVKRLVAGRWYD